jgi:hypothetical protein
LAWSSLQQLVVATTSRRDNKDQMIRPYVVYGQSEDCGQVLWDTLYKATIKINAKDGKQSLVTYVGDIFPMSIELATMEKNMDVLVLTDKTFQSFLFDSPLGPYIGYTCTIAKL